MGRSKFLVESIWAEVKSLEGLPLGCIVFGFFGEDLHDSD